MKHWLFITVTAVVVSAIITLVLIFARPTTVGEPSDEAGPTPVAGSCITDADCVRAGCSSQLCLTVAAAATTVTTCEFTREYACRAEDACGCVAGLCAWSDGAAFTACLEREGEP